LPKHLKMNTTLVEGIRSLQTEMRDGAQLRPLKSQSKWIGAEVWNEDLAGLIG